MICLSMKQVRPWAGLRLVAVAALAFGVLLSPASQAEPRASSGVIEFRTLLRERGGVVRCGLFRKAGWLKSAVASATARADAASALCVFDKIPPGVYALSAF